jgi:hypothetical protein
MIFIINKYTNWYYSIIKTAHDRPVTGYTERHHIIPKSLGGDNSEKNLVRLTAREHFVCHHLLTKMTLGNERVKMLHALGKFIQNNHLQQRNITARCYEISRKAIIEARTGTKRPGVGGVRKGNIPWNKGMTGITHSVESNKSRSETFKNKPITSCPHCGKQGNGNVMFRYHFTNCKNKT